MYLYINYGYKKKKGQKMATTIYEKMDNMTSEIRDIIGGLDDTFDSHDFLKKFAKQCEKKYIEMLCEEKSFREVHKQIGAWIEHEQEHLGLIAKGKVTSENIFGNISSVEQWQKTN